MIKLIATDMDGTFLDSSKRFSMEFFGHCNISRRFGFYNDLINKGARITEATQWN